MAVDGLVIGFSDELENDADRGQDFDRKNNLPHVHEVVAHKTRCRLHDLREEVHKNQP
jgi:hypothetical protein